MFSITVENGTAIRSITEAKLVAKKADGIVSIAPCVKITSSGQKEVCPNSDRIKLCTDPDGVLPDNGTLQCPKQRGPLTLIITDTSGKNNSNGSSHESEVQTLASSKPLILGRKERRPYFVR